MQENGLWAISLQFQKVAEVRMSVKGNFLEEGTEMAQGHGKTFCDVSKASIAIEIPGSIFDASSCHTTRMYYTGY